jgi:hypothetical protein
MASSIKRNSPHHCLRLADSLPDLPLPFNFSLFLIIPILFFFTMTESTSHSKSVYYTAPTTIIPVGYCTASASLPTQPKPTRTKSNLILKIDRDIYELILEDSTIDFSIESLCRTKIQLNYYQKLHFKYLYTHPVFIYNKNRLKSNPYKNIKLDIDKLCALPHQQLNQVKLNQPIIFLKRHIKR